MYSCSRGEVGLKILSIVETVNPRENTWVIMLLTFHQRANTGRDWGTSTITEKQAAHRDEEMG